MEGKQEQFMLDEDIGAGWEREDSVAGVGTVSIGLTSPCTLCVPSGSA